MANISTKNTNEMKENFSSINYIDGSDVDDEYPAETQLKDKNNNGNNEFMEEKQKESNKTHLSNSLHWEYEQNPNNFASSSANAARLSNEKRNIQISLKRMSPIFNNNKVQDEKISEGNYPRNGELKSLELKGMISSSDFASASSKSETEVSSKVRKEMPKSKPLSSFSNQHDSNINNNKKKSAFYQSSKASSSHNLLSRDSQEEDTISHNTSQRLVKQYKHSKERGRSVQLSSIRTMSSEFSKKPIGRLSQRKAIYGQRLVEKGGRSNVHIVGCGKIDIYSRYFHDIFTTLLDSTWSMVLVITSIVYIGHWAIFGIFYWGFAAMNNDYEIIFGPIDTSSNVSLSDSGREPCVYNVYGFVSAFLFSMESETTIGYGSRTITTQCPLAIFCLVLQCVVSAIFDTWIIGVCFARLARPDARTKTTMFSKKAVVCKRDGKRCLLIRFANLRKSLLHSVSVRARLISLEEPQKNEKTHGYQKMHVQRQVTFHNSNCTLLTAPIEYCHVIDRDSPFYGLKSDIFNTTDDINYFELVVIVTGTLESTGLTMLAQTSYLSSEIAYGHRFVPIISKSCKKRKYIVDFKNFHKTVPEVINSYTDNNNPEILSSRDVSAPLIEESEEEDLLANDDVFTTSHYATHVESSL